MGSGSGSWALRHPLTIVQQNFAWLLMHCAVASCAEEELCSCTFCTFELPFILGARSLHSCFHLLALVVTVRTKAKIDDWGQQNCKWQDITEQNIMMSQRRDFEGALLVLYW